MPCERLRRHPRSALAALAGGLALAGCGSSAPGVAVDSYQTNVVFGAEQPVQRAAVNVATPAAPPPLAVGSAFVVPPAFTLPGNSNFTFAPSAPVQLCPTAPPDSFPAEPSTSDVPTPPDAGAYRWAASGTYDLVAGGVHVPLPVAPFFDQEVRHVAPFQDTFPGAGGGGQQGLDFTFATVAPSPIARGGFLQLVWQVKSSPAAGDPEGGLALVEVDTYSQPGGTPSVIFKAAQHDGLLLLPLPAAPGPVQPAVVSVPPPPVPLPSALPTPPSSTESLDTSGANNTLQFSGSVGAVERIDACGTWLQAWPVDGTITDGSGSTAGQATLHMDVATQFGALPVTFDLDGTFLGTTFHRMASHVGQAPPPGPLPQEWK